MKSRRFSITLINLLFITCHSQHAFSILPKHFHFCSELINRLQPVVHQGKLNATGLRFAIVASRWNDLMTSRLVEGAIDALDRLGASEEDIEVFKVPGSFEIPMLAHKVAASRKFDAVICVGTLIRGQTPHFEYIASEVTKGIAGAAMATGVPITYGIITADTVEQALDRAGVKAGNKGFEAAMAAVELVNLYKALTSDK